MAWNPSDKSVNITLSNSNRTATRSGAGNANFGVRSTLAATIKRYFEIVVDSSTSPFDDVGLAKSSWDLVFVGQTTNGWGYYQQTGLKYTNNVGSAFGSAWSTIGTVVGVAYDPEAGKVWFSRNNVWQASGDPVAGTNPAFSGLPSGLYAAISLHRKDAPANVLTGRFVASDLSYSPPSGYTAWDDPAPMGLPRISTIVPHNSFSVARLGL